LSCGLDGLGGVGEGEDWDWEGLEQVAEPKTSAADPARTETAERIEITVRRGFSMPRSPYVEFGRSSSRRQIYQPVGMAEVTVGHGGMLCAHFTVHV
jgi:hypothetical protein